MFAQPELRDEPEAIKRPSRWSPSNWSVQWKVLAIVLVPILLAAGFGGLRIYQSTTAASDLRRTADRASMVRPIENYLATLDGVLLATTDGSISTARTTFDNAHTELKDKLAATDVEPDVKTAVSSLLASGPQLADKVTSSALPIRTLVTTYAPMLLMAEDAIVGSVRLDDRRLLAQAQGLSRAVGARGQMMLETLVIQRGAELPEPELRTSLIALSGTEPSTLFGMAQVLGVASPEAKKLQEEYVRRLNLISDPAVTLVGNGDLLASMKTTDNIADRIIVDVTNTIADGVDEAATAQRNAAIRDAALILGAIILALIIVGLVARSLIRPLRILRRGAMKVAHEDLGREIDEVRAGAEPRPITPIPLHTTEEIGQVAHAVDELHEQAVFLAAEQARLQLQVDDMFETLSRRNRSLVDQQLMLIDQLESNEDDPSRLDSLFKLDHLAARMRRNGANLLVLAGAKPQRDSGEPVTVADVVNAAASEVEDYRRVVVSSAPESVLSGVVAPDVVHLLAELIDNALRYSPPDSQVEVSAAHARDGGLVIEVHDSGLGMTAADLRMANTRLGAGGEVTPFTARHMGLFVVGRLAEQHGLIVRLRSAVAGEANSGTTAGVYVPANLLHSVEPADPVEPVYAEPPLRYPAAPEPRGDEPAGMNGLAYRNGSHPPVTTNGLPQRSPGASGITRHDAPEPEFEPEQEWDAEDEYAEDDYIDEPVDDPADEPAPPSLAKRTPSNTSSFFTARSQASTHAPTNGVSNGVPSAPVNGTNGTANGAPPEPAHPSSPDDSDVIFQRLVSEWLIDPAMITEPFQSANSVWDNGWAAAAHAADAPVETHTEAGLPMRQPGARLVPGSADNPQGRHANGAAHRRDEDDEGVASGAGDWIARDPDAVRASLSSHMGGVRAGRSHARENRHGMESE